MRHPGKEGVDDMRSAKESPYRLTPNLFGIAFGTAGLAQCWAVAGGTVHAPQWPSNVLWIGAAAFWLAITVAYLRNAAAQGRLRSELPDPVTGPFTALLAITPMPLGIALAGHARTAGETVFAAGLVLTVLVGGWLTGVWIRTDSRLPQWHPAYFLPTAAGGLIAAAGCAALGWGTLARVMFGYGLVSWLVLGSIILVRLFTQPMLAPPLVPTIAIEVAPPVVAGNAWFAINGGHLDRGAELLAGYAVLMALVQISMASTYLRAPFGIGHWAFAFSYAAAVTNGLLWLEVEHVSGRRPLTYALLAVATCAWAALAARTLLGLSRRTFLLRVPAPPAAPS
ncbi:Tellurite resistance protein [Actinacidiphila cocklensis]|uniref:Tellurite resistance protein n=2 Tax=Actinacidiphila cocklensis TaxID=887465 RepID=A0A9W4DZI1_9ACTN|nr:Tellurite resistance protein [Actinacidiphila cocklensis]